MGNTKEINMTEKCDILLANLNFDPFNPRLPKSLQGVKDEALVIDYMVKDGNILELMQSIGETGYYDAEPLLVVPDEDNKGKFLVIEGNRRLAALKLLSNPELTSLRKSSVNEICHDSPNKPDNIPVILYHRREDILDYLGYRHITGVKDWGPLEKARYLDQLYKIHVEHVGEETIYAVLAKMIGSRRDYVSKLHTALKLYDYANNEAYFNLDVSEDDIKFSWIYTIISFQNIANYLNLGEPGAAVLENINGENYKQVFTWMFAPKGRIVNDSRELADLNQIVKFPTALAKLDSGANIAESLLYTSAPSDTFQSLLIQARDNLKGCKNLIESLNSPPQNALEILDEVGKISHTISSALKGILEKNTSDNTDLLNELSPDMLEKLKALLSEQES